MDRPTSSKDTDAQAKLAELSKMARARLAAIVQEIEALVREIDPVELLSMLTLLYLTHRVDEQPDRDEAATWHVYIEWLSWLMFSRRMRAPERPRVIDSSLLLPLEELLRDYVATTTMALAIADSGLSTELEELRSLIQLKAIHVRGEAYANQHEEVGVAVYAPHNQWCVKNLGFTVEEAFALAKAISHRFSRRLRELREEREDVVRKILANPAHAATLSLPLTIRQQLAHGGPLDTSGNFATAIGGLWLCFQARLAVGFTLEELQAEVAGAISPERVAAFLAFASQHADAIDGEPTLLALSPIAKVPLIEHEGRHFLFVPALLIQSLGYALHSSLYRDEDYRPVYDDARAAWLEQAAIAGFQKMLPEAVSGWGLTYGPKKERLQLDGLLLYGNKLILVECKWKRPTLSALGGDMVAALKDVDAAILQPLAQAKRARRWVDGTDSADFVEESTGRRITIRKDAVKEVFLVTLVGSDAWAFIAVNLVRLAPIGMFADGEYPWAVSINDLRVAAELFALPSQLFDYLRRRHKAQRNPKFVFHDEWDLLGVYLAGFLDTNHPRYEGVDRVYLDQFDSGMQDYYHSLNTPEIAAPKPRRNLPQNIFDLLCSVERAPTLDKTDAICVVLSWSDDGIEALGRSLNEVRQKTVLNGRSHAVTLIHEWSSSGVAFACGYRDRRAIRATLAGACEKHFMKMNVKEWVGFGIDLAAPWDPIVAYGLRSNLEE